MLCSRDREINVGINYRIRILSNHEEGDIVTRLEAVYIWTFCPSSPRFKDLSSLFYINFLWHN